jgi:short-subunit dehydrogenase
MAQRLAQRLSGKVVLITGASRPEGIGAAAAQRFAGEGATVAITARGAAGLEAVAAGIRDRGGQARAFPADLSTPAGCEAMLRAVDDAFGGLDVLVNNAGANTRGPVEAQDPLALANVIQVNLIAPIILTRLALPRLAARGGGSIVQVASIAGQIPLDGEATYSASKHGLRAFSFALREELAGSSIHVAVVSPGPVETGFLLDELDEVPDIVFANPMSTADEVAALIVEGALDGRRERTIPARTGALARLGAAVPSLRRALAPAMKRRGKAAKAAFRERHRG